MFRPLNVRREGLEVIYRAYGMLQAEAIKGRLEASGIPAVLDFESIGQTFGIAVDGLGEVRVLVPTERADEARELLQVSSEDEGVDELMDEEEEEQDSK